jgi:hypothetical protein
MKRHSAIALLFSLSLAAPLGCGDDEANTSSNGGGGSSATTASGPTSSSGGVGPSSSSASTSSGPSSGGGDPGVGGAGGNGSGGSGVGGSGVGGSGVGGSGVGGSGVGGSGVGGSGVGGSGSGGAGQCSDLGAPCLDGAECCTGNCDPTLQVCTGIGACGEAGEPCAVGPDCCTFSCVGGQCSALQCTADGDICAADGECCGGSCPAGLCEPLGDGCLTSGNPCSDNSDCCSDFCQDGLCSAPSYCTQNDDICTSDFQCCSGDCEIAQGALFGTCDTVDATGDGGCLSAGEVCGEGASCSRACFPYGPTGVLICQPPSGCRPTGEVCANDTDCCGSETLPDGRESGIVCNKVDGNPLGRCDMGNSCTPAGGICRLQALECNANANCCAGNVLQFDTCKQDNLGIPRCLIAEIDCTNPEDFVGDECATSADCCGLPCVPNPNGNDPPLVCLGECVPSGGTCTTSADCCSGIPCIIPPGSTEGLCQPDDPTGAGGAGGGGGVGGGDTECAEYGQACDDATDCCNTVPCTNGFCIVT